MDASNGPVRPRRNWSVIVLAILVGLLVFGGGTWVYMNSLSSDPRSDAERLTQNIKVSMQKKFDEVGRPSASTRIRK